MSSFICSSNLFNSIEQAIQDLTRKDNFCFPYSLQKSYPELCSKNYYSSQKVDAVVKNIIFELRRINAICTTLKYAGSNKKDIDTLINEQINITLDKKERQELTKVELFKQIQCLQYQIELEYILELSMLTPAQENAMLFLSEFKNTLAIYIISCLPNYDLAPWGI